MKTTLPAATTRRRDLAVGGVVSYMSSWSAWMRDVARAAGRRSPRRGSGPRRPAPASRRSGGCRRPRASRRRPVLRRRRVGCGGGARRRAPAMRAAAARRCALGRGRGRPPRGPTRTQDSAARRGSRGSRLPRDPRSGFSALDQVRGHPHHVVAAVDVEDLAGDPARQGETRNSAASPTSSCSVFLRSGAWVRWYSSIFERPCTPEAARVLIGPGRDRVDADAARARGRRPGSAPTSRARPWPRPSRCSAAPPARRPR